MPHRSRPPRPPRARRRPASPLALVSLAVAIAAAPAALGAQGVGTGGDQCYGFAFGPWKPALDQRAAGHHAIPPDQLAHAPGGRDWAAAVSTGRDTTLLLFPAWWPAGVAIAFPAGVRTPSDTVRGRATALVADGRVRNPEASVLAWPVPCSGRAPDRGSGGVLPARRDSTDSTDATGAPSPTRPSSPSRPTSSPAPGDGSAASGG